MEEDIETFGGWGRETEDTLKQIVSGIAGGNDNAVYSKLWSDLQYRIAVELAKGQGRLLLRLDRRMREAMGTAQPLSTSNSVLVASGVGSSQ